MTSRLYAVCVGLAFPSALVGLDLVMPFCSQVPLAGYLVACVIGATVGSFRARRHESAPRVRGLVIAAISICGSLAAISLVVWPNASWGSQCGYRYCERALGLNLGSSPFPVGTPTCSDLSMCANEAVLSAEDHAELVELNRTSSCPAW